MRSLIAELVGVALIAAGTYLLVGVGPALIVTGVLVIIGAQLYGSDEGLDLTVGEALRNVRVTTRISE